MTDRSYPELNRDLLVRVVNHALSSPNWDQSVWVSEHSSCGTSYCIAGFTAIVFAGWQLLPFTNGLDVTKDGETKYVSEVAEEELGLTIEEADLLFAGGNDADDVRRITKNILDGVYR